MKCNVINNPGISFFNNRSNTQSVKVERVHSEVLVVPIPLPDFSMPYNVIVITCTLMALSFGFIFNMSFRVHRVTTVCSYARKLEFICTFLVFQMIADHYSRSKWADSQYSGSRNGKRRGGRQVRKRTSSFRCWKHLMRAELACVYVKQHTKHMQMIHGTSIL